MNKPLPQILLPVETGLAYQSGFGNEFASEALPGALPVGQNSPQQAPYGLYAEVISGTAFTAPRHQNRRTWMYRMRPSAHHGAYHRVDNGRIRSAPLAEIEAPFNRLRWNPLPLPDAGARVDFIAGLVTIAGNGDVATQVGCAAHVYCANASMTRVAMNADGELLIVPQQGALVVVTELGRLAITPGEIAVIPRGMRFRVQLQSDAARGYVCENYGAPLRLPELGTIGSNGLANARDFQVPTASFEERDEACDVVAKFQGRLWQTTIDHSPFDVIAWHGNNVPYKYDLARFNTINTVSFDHPDPSIFTVLTSPSDTPGTANVDFVIFPPRWLVAEHTFQPPWFHRNVMSELMGLIHGVYDAKAEGFLPGSVSLHNCMTAHGPDAATFEKGSTAELAPHRIEDTLAFMFETRFVWRPTAFAMNATELQSDYDACWSGFRKSFVG